MDMPYCLLATSKKECAEGREFASFFFIRNTVIETCAIKICDSIVRSSRSNSTKLFLHRRKIWAAHLEHLAGGVIFVMCIWPSDFFCFSLHISGSGSYSACTSPCRTEYTGPGVDYKWFEKHIIWMLLNELWWCSHMPGAALGVVVRSAFGASSRHHDPTSSDIRKTVNRKKEVEASRQQTHPYKLGFQHSIIIIRHVGHYFFSLHRHRDLLRLLLAFHIWNDATTEK